MEGEVPAGATCPSMLRAPETELTTQRDEHCGVPVLTVTGTTAAGRVGASVVRAAGLGDLVCANLADYDARAVALAADPAALAAVKARLAAARASCPLWDAGDLARCLERAFETMWARHEAGSAPAALDLPAA